MDAVAIDPAVGPTVGPATRRSPLAAPWRGLTIGIVAAITLVGFETLGVTTAMPVAARALGGERWYGWAFALALLAQVVSITVTGADLDAHGPRRAFLWGLALLAFGLVVGATAQHITMLLVSRAIVGLGSGAVLTCGYSVIGLAYPDDVRPRMLAVASSSWVVPGLVGPFLAGRVTELWSWRWAIAGVLPIAVLAAAVVAPRLRGFASPASAAHGGTDRPADVDGDPFWRLHGARRTFLAVGAAGGAAMVLGGLQSVRRPALAVAAIVAGLVLLTWSLRRGLVPMAVLRAERGLGATILGSAALLGAWTAAEAFVPLALQRLRGLSSTRAGLAITAGTFTWFVGSWLHARSPQRWRRVSAARVALLLVGCGGLGMAALVSPRVPLAVAIACWALSGLGQGLAFNVAQERPFMLVTPERLGIVSGALQTAGALGGGLAAGIGGALVAMLATRGPAGDRATPAGIGWALASQLVWVVAALWLFGRFGEVPHTAAEPTVSDPVASDAGMSDAGMSDAGMSEAGMSEQVATR